MLKGKKVKSIVIGVILIVITLVNLTIVPIGEVYASNTPEKFDLREQISIGVKNQGPNSSCTSLAKSTVYETHIKLGMKQGKYSFFKYTPVFSALYSLPITTDQTEPLINKFYNGKYKTEEELFSVEGEYMNKELLEYLGENGIKQSCTIYTDASEKKEGMVDIEGIVKDTVDGKIVYKSTVDKKSIDKNRVNAIRNNIKNFITEHGGIESSIQTDGICDGTNGRAVCNSVNKITKVGNHAIVIIGWDDNYSKYNFPEEHQPSENGAYLVVNSWGKDANVDGTFYVSYEDLYIEDGLSGVYCMEEYKDTSTPNIIFKADTYGKLKINVTDLYSSGVNEDSIKYLVTQHNIEPTITDSRWNSIKNGETIDIKDKEIAWVYAEDKAGNASLMSTARLKNTGLYFEGIKKDSKGIQIPEWSNKDVMLTISSAQDTSDKYDVWYSSDTLSDKDISSNLKEMENCTRTLNISKEGKHKIYFTKVLDGEEYLAQAVDIWIDKTKPTDAKIIISGEKDGEGYCQGASVKIEKGTDELSGIKNVDISVKNDNGQEVNIANKENFDLYETGNYTINVVTTDNAGNENNTELNVSIVKKEKLEDNEDKDKAEYEKKSEDAKPDNNVVDESVANKMLPQTGKLNRIYVIGGVVIVLNMIAIAIKRRRMKL